MRLCEIAALRWAQIEAAYYQIDLLRQRPNRFVNLVYAWAIQLVAPDKVEDWLAELVEPLDWQDINSESIAELESNSFMAAMGANPNNE